MGFFVSTAETFSFYSGSFIGQFESVTSVMRYCSLCRKAFILQELKASVLMYLNHTLVVLLMGFLFGCSKETEQADDQTIFEAVPQKVPLEVPVNEVSGIAASARVPNGLWAIEDSGNPANLILLGTDGSHRVSKPVPNSRNLDWEDLVRVGETLYIGDIGDNGKSRTSCMIYILEEPDASDGPTGATTGIRFKYPDGPRDAEAFLVDPASRDIFIVTKSDSLSRIYRLAFPYSEVEVNTLVFEGTLPFNGVTSAALSPDGKEVVVKTYLNIYYSTRTGGEPLSKMLSKVANQISYQAEPQGEAMTFAHDNAGFYTLSEKGFASGVSLCFYRRK